MLYTVSFATLGQENHRGSKDFFSEVKILDVEQQECCREGNIVVKGIEEAVVAVMLRRL